MKPWPKSSAMSMDGNLFSVHIDPDASSDVHREPHVSEASGSVMSEKFNLLTCFKDGSFFSDPAERAQASGRLAGAALLGECGATNGCKGGTRDGGKRFAAVHVCYESAQGATIDKARRR